MTGFEIIFLIAFICFCLLICFWIVYMIIDYKQTQTLIRKIRETELELKITGEWWRL